MKSAADLSYELQRLNLDGVELEHWIERVQKDARVAGIRDSALVVRLVCLWSHPTGAACDHFVTAAAIGGLVDDRGVDGVADAINRFFVEQRRPEAKA